MNELLVGHEGFGWVVRDLAGIKLISDHQKRVRNLFLWGLFPFEQAGLMQLVSSDVRCILVLLVAN